MADGWPTLNALKVARLFLESTGKLRHTYGLSKQTGMPEESARTALRGMKVHGWLTAKSSSRRVFYELTETGLKEAKEELKPLQLTATSRST
ncbi:MAG TPA: hypothetical protein VKG24_33905 [Pseudolabrys sp.]|nr:hypothetical protein [Pseudolabrys sp.]